MQCIPTTYILALAKKAYGMKLDLLTNAAVIEDAGRFIQDKKKELLLQQPIEQPPQETEQEQQQEQEPETFNKTF
jgi:hypothetical protein